jgi:hypothetical protein
MADRILTRDDIRRILAAGADVIFSDGVAEAFLEQWADETMFMLSLGQSARVTPAPGRSGDEPAWRSA